MDRTEELPPKLLLDTYLKVDEVRFDGDSIRRLYENPEYPLPDAPQRVGA